MSKLLSRSPKARAAHFRRGPRHFNGLTGHYLQRRDAHAAPSNLQVEGIQNPSEGNQNHSEQNQSPAERNPNPAERNPNLTSFHEPSLFNGLSPILAGRALQSGRDGRSPQPEQTVNGRFTRLSRECRFLRNYAGAGISCSM